MRARPKNCPEGQMGMTNNLSTHTVSLTFIHYYLAMMRRLWSSLFEYY